MINTKEKLKKLIHLLGVPTGMETGFIVGGQTGGRIVNSRTCKKTDYLIGGRTGHQIVLINTGEIIGSVSAGFVGRIYCDEIRTNYQIGGRTGRRILYMKRLSK